MTYRTHHCNALRSEDAGTTATLCGWVASRRDHGGVIFIDLRDREGLTQVVFRPEESPDAASRAHELRGEDVVRAVVVARDAIEHASNLVWFFVQVGFTHPSSLVRKPHTKRGVRWRGEHDCRKHPSAQRDNRRN